MMGVAEEGVAVVLLAVVLFDIAGRGLKGGDEKDHCCSLGGLKNAHWSWVEN